MRFLFRFDATTETGHGHLYRCLAILNEIRKLECNIELFCLGNYSTVAEKEIEAGKIYISRIDTSYSEEKNILQYFDQFHVPELLFIDKLYAYTQEFISILKTKTKVVMLHNICEGAYHTNAFILPSEHHPEKTLNKFKLQLKDKFYFGSPYIVLNRKITEYKIASVSANNRLVITTGGSDPKKVMKKIFSLFTKLRANELMNNIEVIGLIGNSFSHEYKQELKLFCNHNLTLKNFNIKDLAEANTVICTFGITTYELIYLKKFIISIGHQESNALGSKILGDKGLIYNLGFYELLDEHKLQKSIFEVLNNGDLRSKLSNNLKGFIDDRGALRIAKILLRLVSF